MGHSLASQESDKLGTHEMVENTAHDVDAKGPPPDVAKLEGQDPEQEERVTAKAWLCVFVR